jgi:hypothetical protein
VRSRFVVVSLRLVVVVVVDEAVVVVAAVVAAGVVDSATGAISSFVEAFVN